MTILNKEENKTVLKRLFRLKEEFLAEKEHMIKVFETVPCGTEEGKRSFIKCMDDHIAKIDKLIEARNV